MTTSDISKVLMGSVLEELAWYVLVLVTSLSSFYNMLHRPFVQIIT